MMRHRLVAAAIICVGFASTTRGQVVLSMPGKRLEIVGLRQWTIPMIQDSLRKYADGVTLDSHACAAALRYKLGFADASATSFGVLPGDSVQSVFIAVVEPQDSARVMYRPAPMDTTIFRVDWARTARLIDRNMGALVFVLDEIAGRQTRRPSPAIPKQLDSTAVIAFRSFLASHSSDADEVAAQHALSSDPNDRTRILAAAILANFTTRDANLVRLLEASRETDGRVKLVAGDVLFNFAQDTPRPVDWRPAVDALHAMLDGTSLFQAMGVMDLLVASRVDSALATPILKAGGQAVLDFLGARHPWPRESAHKLLVALSGRDLGYDVGRWRRWIESL